MANTCNKNYKFLKFIFISAFCLIFNLNKAQVSGYSFAQGAGTTSALTVPYTTHGSGTIDDVTYTAVPIGFTFFFDCNAYTTVSLCANGFVAMGNSITSSYNPISSGSTNNVISAMGADLQGLATATLRTKTTGSAPNRQFFIEYLHFETYLGADDYSFTIVLTETTNTIQIYYSAATTVASNTFEVGLRGASTADFNNRTKVNATNWTASSAGVLNTDVMSTGGSAARNPNGLFTWTPTAPSCAGTPTAGTSSASPTSISTCASLTSSLSLTGATTGCGITYQWQSAPAAGGPWTNVSGATTTPYTISPPVGTTYYRCVVTCTNSGLSANSTTVSISNTAPVPANNECSSATGLTMNSGASCASFSSGTVACASPSADANPCFGTADDDVWYSFVAPASGMVNISLFNVAGSTTDLYHAVYSGSCGSLTNVSCTDPNTSAVTGLTPGATYYIRVYTYTATSGQTTTFDICVQNPCPSGAPANDECVNATTVTVNSGLTCTSTVSGTIACATASAQANSCAGTDDDDVWYKFVAPASGIAIISLTNITGSTSDLYFVVYSGTCGSLTSVLCSDPESNTVTGLTPGATYYIRVYSYTSTGNQTSAFDICINNPCPSGAPANDECVNAVNVPVNASVTCGTSVAGSISCATASAPANPCIGTDDDDVWFKFTATATNISISLSGFVGTTTDMMMSVYSGTCGSLTNIACSDPESMNLSGLTIGATYYVRVYTYTSTTNQYVNFDICITQTCPTGAPANDECVNAITLTPAGSSCTTTTTGTINCATASAQANSCFGTDDDDVWYKFVATSPSHTINITNITGTTTDLYHVIYSGTCGSLTNVLCSDPNSSTLTGLTIGATYYIRIYTYTATANQTAVFDICILTNGPCGNPANNDYCSNPATLTYTPSSSFSSTTAATFTADQPANTGTVFCGSIENNSWYQFVATATTHVFNFTSVTGCGSGIQAEVYSITHDVNGCCTNVTSVSNCWNPATATSGTVTATPLTIGQTYVLMIDGFAGANCNYTVADWGAVGILPVELTNFSGSRVGEDNLIYWQTASERNNDYFILERSTDGINFYGVARIEGQGNSNQLVNYNYTDKNVNNDLTYYRLRDVNNDGAATVSGLIAIKNQSEIQFNIFPNPANEYLNINLISENSGNYLILYSDLIGNNTVEKVFVNAGATNLNSSVFSTLANGVYIVHLVNESNTIVKSIKIIKQ